MLEFINILKRSNKYDTVFEVVTKWQQKIQLMHNSNCPLHSQFQTYWRSDFTGYSCITAFFFFFPLVLSAPKEVKHLTKSNNLSQNRTVKQKLKTTVDKTMEKLILLCCRSSVSYIFGCTSYKRDSPTFLSACSCMQPLPSSW